ncbi:hypothetical protein CPB86DRAFT_196940 [Serendipita vermifera]|nr:hypothetical protein CPB86DRAFT_196940 [Serendipita vermifera]
MENEESSSTSSSSFTESRMELDCRLVNLSPLGICDATIPPTWSVTEGSSYSDINKEMNEKIQLSESNLSLLTQKFGPRPCWKFPEMDEMIPPSIKTLYLVDDSKLFLIALLRSVDGDSPIFVDLSHETRQEDRTILNVLESTMTCHNLDPLATNIYSNSDSIDQAMTETIGDRIFDYNSLKLHPKFPTTFYICSVSAPDDFIVGLLCDYTPGLNNFSLKRLIILTPFHSHSS